MNKDIYQEITNRIINSVDSAGKWSPPWKMVKPKMPVNAISNKRYSGTNVLMCWLTAMEKGYSSHRWATFKQWAEKKVSINKGEKGTPIIFFKAYEKINEQGEPDKILMARQSYVFNADQTDEKREEAPETPGIGGADSRNLPIDVFIYKTGAEIEVAGQRAYYQRAQDKIYMPPMPLFNGPEYYYGTLLHELVHWTGAEKRLDREKGKRFGDDAYAMEELVAEIGAAFMCAEFGIESTTRDDHASYIKHWLEVLQKDKKAIVSAASMAEKAVAFMQEKVGEQAMKEAA